MFRQGQLAVHGLAILLGRNEAGISNRGKFFLHHAVLRNGRDTLHLESSNPSFHVPQYFENTNFKIFIENLPKFQEILPPDQRRVQHRVPGGAQLGRNRRRVRQRAVGVQRARAGAASKQPRRDLVLRPRLFTGRQQRSGQPARRLRKTSGQEEVSAKFGPRLGEIHTVNAVFSSYS